MGTTDDLWKKATKQSGTQLKARRRTADEARKDGLTIDDTTYPWCAYRGPRFEPEYWEPVLTDLESTLLTVCQRVEKGLGVLPVGIGLQRKLQELLKR